MSSARSTVPSRTSTTPGPHARSSSDAGGLRTCLRALSDHPPRRVVRVHLLAAPSLHLRSSATASEPPFVLGARPPRTLTGRPRAGSGMGRPEARARLTGPCGDASRCPQTAALADQKTPGPRCRRAAWASGAARSSATRRCLDDGYRRRFRPARPRRCRLPTARSAAAAGTASDRRYVVAKGVADPAHTARTSELTIPSPSSMTAIAASRRAPRRSSRARRGHRLRRPPSAAIARPPMPVRDDFLGPARPWIRSDRCRARTCWRGDRAAQGLRATGPP